MKKIILAIGFVMLVFAVQAQKTGKDSIASNKRNELLVDFVPLTLTSNHNPGYLGLMYRRNFNKISLRAKVEGSGGGSRSDFHNHGPYGYMIRTSVGIQKNVPLTNFCQFYWGADLFYFNRNRYSRDSSSTFLTNTNAVGLAPLVGIKFSLGKRFVIGVENSGSFSYQDHSKKQTNPPPYTIVTPSHSSSVDFNVTNGLRVFLGLKF